FSFLRRGMSPNLNLMTLGTYEVIYTATDVAGNTAKETITVTVKASSSSVTLDSVNSLADEVLSSIITTSMSDYQKIKAIYNWVRNHLSYADGTDKPAYYVAAYKGFTKRSGDCYVYWATSKVLLTRAGISNMDIKKTDTSVSGHYWSLVNIGEGWHHFDTTPRKGGFDGFYLTDEELMAYSESHNNSHIYDASLYPDIA
ncbi:MAG: hypothetical protein LUF02_05075, partial [Erysipelotrichaceae bacterium]|nr:hypothetical protein [Erysipelotrichaceae bacterium]